MHFHASPFSHSRRSQFALIGTLALVACIFSACTTTASYSPLPRPLPPATAILADQGSSSGLAEPPWVTKAGSLAYRNPALFVLEEGELAIVAAAEADNRQSAEVLAKMVNLEQIFSHEHETWLQSAVDTQAPPEGPSRTTYKRLSLQFLETAKGRGSFGLRESAQWWMLVRRSGFLGLPGKKVYRAFILATMQKQDYDRYMTALFGAFVLTLSEEDRNLPELELLRGAVAASWGVVPSE
jgi:hypothetical protein